MASKGLPNRMMSNATVTIPASEYKALLRDKAALDFLQAEMDKARVPLISSVRLHVEMVAPFGRVREISQYKRTSVFKPLSGLDICTSSTDIRYLLAKAAREADDGEAQR